MTDQLAKPEDQHYQISLSSRLARNLSPEEKALLKLFNEAVCRASGKEITELPIMPVRSMQYRRLGVLGRGFRYGLAAEYHGFTMATDYFSVLLKSAAREIGITFPKPGS